MAHLVYLLGAGASVEVVPTVRDFGQRMIDFRSDTNFIDILPRMQALLNIDFKDKIEFSRISKEVQSRKEELDISANKFKWVNLPFFIPNHVGFRY